MIPKTIYQTWKTQNLPEKVTKLHKKFKALNRDYNHIIYTDEQMNDYINSNVDKEIANVYWKMKHIVAKADIWRYSILFNEGGIYVDIDSSITGSLDKLIKDEDKAIVSAETNKNLFVQWALVYEKKHIILENTLNNILRDVYEENNKYDHHSLTVENYAKSIYKAAKESSENLEWNEINNSTDLTFYMNSSSFRLYGIDYNNFFQFKHKYNHLLRDRPKGVELDTHWSLQEQKPLY